MSAAAGPYSRSASVSAPANVLLLGEYAVLEEGGLGVTMAVDRRVHAVLSSAKALRIEGLWGAERASWPSDDNPSLLGSVVASAAERLDCGAEALAALPLQIDIDSGPFYDSSGAKLGFGSSAAVAAAVSFALVLAVGPDASFPRSLQPEAADPLPEALFEKTFQVSLAAHRSFQGGTGSGYDLAASVYGGIGRFEGGERPSLKPMTPAWLPTPILFKGTSPVKTPAAVARYSTWKQANPRAAEEFLQRSNECVEGFLAADDWKEAKAWLESAKELGLSLGKQIGVPAEISPPPPFQDSAAKAVGAGDELGIILAETRELPGTLPLSFTPLVLAREGVRIDHDR